MSVALCALAAGPLLASPLPESSPLYSPNGSQIVNENPAVTAEYSGKVTELWEYPAVGSSPERIHRTATLEWTEGVSGPVDQIEYTGIYGAESIHWQLTRLSGEVNESSTGPGGEPITCTGSFLPRSVDGGEGGVFVPLETPGHPAGGGNPATNADYSVRPPFGMPSGLLESTGRQGSYCETNYWNSNGNSGWGGGVFSAEEAAHSEWNDVAGPTVYFPPGGSPAQPLNFSYTCQPPSCGPESTEGKRYGKVMLSVESSIAFSSPGVPTGGNPTLQKSTPEGGGLGPTVPFDWLEPDKRAARLDLDPALENAKEYCTPYALGLGGFGTGILLAGSGSIGSILVVAGSLTAIAAEPFCVATLKRVAADIKRYEDPPDPNIDAVARPALAKAPTLPSCARWHGAKRTSFCRRLRAAETRWVSAAGEAATIDEALMTTTNRESAALSAHDESAIALQGSTGLALEVQEARALSAKDSAGREAAAVLRGAGVRFRLTRTQSKATLKAVERALAKEGVTASQLNGIGSPSLEPGAADLLAGMGS